MTKFKYMKHRIIGASVALALISISATAYVTVPFRGWEDLEAESQDIAIVFPLEPTRYPAGVEVSGPRSDYTVSVESHLKGTNEISSVRLLTDHELQGFHRYLVFGYYTDGCLYAFESYRVIPLGETFDLRSIDGKTLDQQLQIMFQDGVKEMDRKIQDDEAEKQRLEEALHQ